MWFERNLGKEDLAQFLENFMGIRQKPIVILMKKIRNQPPNEEKKKEPEDPANDFDEVTFVFFRHLYISGKGSLLTLTILNRIRGKGNQQMRWRQAWFGNHWRRLFYR